MPLTGGLLSIITDLTEDERMAQELRDARVAAEAASRAKSEFVASMSHELRTPLNAILGFAQLLVRDKKTPLEDRHRERVDRIVEGGEHLLNLVDDVLDLSRIEAGHVSVAKGPVGVSDALDDAMSALKPIAADGGIAIEVAPLPDALPFLTADRTRFVQILVNFGTNAIKYNHRGGKVIFTVTLPSHEEVRVTVEDTGDGIPVDEQGRLFLPFHRAGREAGPVQGTGVGLAIAKRIAELMGGTVGFHSILGEGSEFWVELPAHVGSQGD